MRLATILAVAAGGALGAVARFGVGAWIQQLARPAFPWGTLAINVSGSLALGFLVVWLEAALAGMELRVFLTVGVLGGFTTFSTFSLETVALLRDGDFGRAALYSVGSLVLGVLAAFGGMALAQRWLSGAA